MIRFRNARILLVSFIVLTLGCAQKVWLPQSDEQVQSLKKIVSKHVAELAEKNDYFPSSFTEEYTDAVLNSLNKNNGKAAIIAHDGLRWTKFKFILSNNEKIRKLTVTKYAKDFGEVFKKYKVDQSQWSDLIHQFNTKGYAILGTNVYVKYYYDYEEEIFLIESDKLELLPGKGSVQKKTGGH
jgi:hypothetical protein